MEPLVDDADEWQKLPRLALRLSMMISSEDVAERKEGVMMLQEGVKTSRCSMLWLLYVEYVAKALKPGQPLAPAVWRSAIEAAGCDPLAFPLWSKVISLLQASLTSAVAANSADVEPLTKQVRGLYQRALITPLAGHEHGNMLMIYEQFERECAKRAKQPMPTLDAALSAQHLAAKDMWHQLAPLWPDRYLWFVNEGSPGAALHFQQYNALLQIMFIHQLSQQFAQPEKLFQQRVFVVFELMLASHPHNASAWLQYALYMRSTGNEPAVTNILKRGHKEVPSLQVSVALKFTLKDEGNQEAMEAIELPDVGKVAFMTASNEIGGEHKTIFRSIGKNAVASGKEDWQLYHQWADIESTVREDSTFSSTVLGKCIDHIKFTDTTNNLLFSMLAADYFAVKGDEIKLKNIMERTLQHCKGSATNGQKADIKSRLVAETHRFGDPPVKTRTNADDVTAPSTTLTLLRRYRSALGILPCSDEDAILTSQMQDVREAVLPQDPVLEDSRRKMELADFPVHCDASVAVQDQVRASVESDWGVFKRPPASMAAMGGNKETIVGDDMLALDEVVGPRALEGTLHDPMHLNAVTNCRLQYEADRRKQAAADTDDTNAMKELPKELQQLVKMMADAKESALQDPEVIRSPLERVNHHWVMNLVNQEPLDMKSELDSFMEKRAKRGVFGPR